MKYKFYLNLLLCFFSLTAIAQPTYEFEHYSMGGPNSAEFTTNNFKCIAVGKGNVIWAGTQYGGLYMYSDSFNIWRKSDKLTNVFINDIKADPDSGIWIAQSGTTSQGGNSNIAGGVNYFPVGSDLSMNFYSVPGTESFGYLVSRNVKGLYIDPRFKSSEGKLPRPWAVSGTYITSGNAKRGGVNIGLNQFSPFFNTITAGFSSASNATPICEAIGGNSEEVWVASRQNQSGSQIIRYRPSGVLIDYINTANTPELPGNFTGQAILFDRHGNKWVGLKYGGLRIKNGADWQTMNFGPFTDINVQVNFNAMVEDEFGNVYIGTTNGLLMFNSPTYKPTNRPENISAYEHFTTTNGLLNNNVTGLSYDKKNGKVLITTSGGVTFMKVKQPHIKGVVFNVFTNIDSTNNPYPGLQKVPFKTGENVQARLLKDGEEKEFQFVDADGSFEFKEANETDAYSVEVKHQKDGKTIKYLYNDIRNHTLLKPALIPESLIGEIKAFIPKLKKRCLPLKLQFGLEFKDKICTDLPGLGSDDAFNTGNYESGYYWFYDAAGISVDHDKRVDNLANYYASLATVYQLGGQATDLIAEATGGFLDALEALKGLVEFQVGLSKPDPNPNDLVAWKKNAKDEFSDRLSEAKDVLITTIQKSSRLMEPKLGAQVEKWAGVFGDAVDVLIAAYKDGRKGAFLKVLVENTKKLIGQYVAVGYYKKSYAQDRHKYFVSGVSLGSFSNSSELTYNEAYDNLFSPTNNSLAKIATDTFDNKKILIRDRIELSKYADAAAKVSEGVVLLSAGTGVGAAVAPFAFAISRAFKGAKVALLVFAGVQGVLGANSIADLSDSIENKAGFRAVNVPVYYSGILARLADDTLVARKNRVNNILTNLQDIYSVTPVNTASFISARNQLIYEDSLYLLSLKTSIRSLLSTADSASVIIPGYKERLTKVVDSFYTAHANVAREYYYKDLAYVYADDRTPYISSIDSSLVEIKAINDSIVYHLGICITDVNNASLNAKAILLQDKYVVNHSRVPGTNGTVSYTFSNYGDEQQNNVSFKITDLTGGYTVLSADSINVGNILPFQSKQITYTFKAPMTDDLSSYRIQVKADNGIYSDAVGSFYVIDPTKCYTEKDGNWNDPTTWSCGVVPPVNSPVVIGHDVKVTANAGCKSVKILPEGKLTIETGNNLNIIP